MSTTRNLLAGQFEFAQYPTSEYPDGRAKTKALHRRLPCLMQKRQMLLSWGLRSADLGDFLSHLAQLRRLVGQQYTGMRESTGEGNVTCGEKVNQLVDDKFFFQLAIISLSSSKTEIVENIIF